MWQSASMFLQNLVKYSFLLFLLVISGCHTEIEESQQSVTYKIDGKVVIPFTSDNDWVSTTRIFVDGGEYLGFLRADGSFTVNNIPSGSYVVEVSNPVYIFEPVRVDINSKGKIRARRLNNIQTSAVVTVTYPLRFKAKSKANYFQIREQWRIQDFLMNPMVLMMVLPLLMIMVLPKLINTQDPETQKEMQQQMSFLNSKQQMPEMSEIFTNWLGGGKKPTKAKAVKRR